MFFSTQGDDFIPGEIVLLPLIGLLLAIYISIINIFEFHVLGSLPLAFGFEITTLYLSLLVTFIALFLWILIALIVFKHAKKHSKHPKSWAVVTLLIGMFGVLLYLLFGRKGGGPA